MSLESNIQTTKTLHMNTWHNTRESILATPVPATTHSYTPIPHSLFLEEIGEALDKRGYRISEELHLGSKDNQVVSSVFRISGTDMDQDMRPSISTVNSYNKQRKAAIRASAMVLVCKNGMMGMVEQGYYARKHNGNALEEFRERLDIIVKSIEDEFQRLVRNKEEMKNIELDSKTRALLIGDMYINERMITSTQLNIIKREIDGTGTNLFTGNTVWDFYNHITESLKECQPYTYDRDHVKVHTYISDNFNLSGSRGLYFPIINN